MKKLILILVILITSITNAQTFDFDCLSSTTTSTTNTGSTAGSALTGNMWSDIDFDSENGTVTETLIEIANTFLNDVSKYDVSLEDAYQWDFSYYPFVSDNGLSNHTVAARTTYCNGNMISIEVNSNTWESYFNTDIRKLFLIYHELGHAVLNLKHSCTTNDIMHPGTQQHCGTHVSDDRWNHPTDIMATFITAKDRMFNGEGQTYESCNTSKRSRIIEEIIH